MRHRNRIILCCFIILVAWCPLQAGSKSFRFHGLTENLPSLSISSIAQDSRGFLWFGTQAGLAMYDGHGYITHTSIPFAENVLSSNLIQTMMMDGNDVLWIGTYAGLDRYDIQTDTFTHYSVGSDVVVSILKDSKGRIWAGTLDGLGCLAPDASIFTVYRKETPRYFIGNNTVRNLYEDRAGRIYACTYDGLWEYDEKKDSFALSHLVVPGNPAATGTTYDIREDSAGDYWIARWNVGFVKVSKDAGSYRVYPLSDNRIYCMNTSFDPNLILAGTWGGGLNVLDKTTGKVTSYTEHSPSGQRLTNDIVYSIYVDRTGLLWLGTNGGGLNIHDPAHSWFSSIEAGERPDELPFGKVDSILKDKSGDMWIAIANRGLTRYSPATNKFRNYRANAEGKGEFPASAVYCVYRDSRGRILAGTERGILEYQSSSDSFSRPAWSSFLKMIDNSIKISRIVETRDGSYWIGTWEDGLYRYFPGSGKFVQYKYDPANAESLSDNLVYMIIEDRSGNVWIGTNKGLDRFDPKTGKMTSFYYDKKNTDGISSNTMFCAYEDFDGTIYFGTRNGGLCVWHPATKKFTHLTSADGLPSNTIVGICPSSEGFLWLATQNGLVRYGIARKSLFVYRTSDGLLSQQFNSAWSAPDEDLRYFGTPLGVVWFSENDVTEGPSSIPGVALTSIMVNNQSLPVPYRVNETTKITLQSDQRNINFGYTALDFSPFSRYTSSYKLEGFDSSWIEAGDRDYAMYTNLNPGNYRFSIHVDSLDDRIATHDTVILISILKPIYLRWYALVLYFVALVALSFMLYRIRKSQLLERKVGELEATANDLQSENVHLEHLSYHDSLTAIPNRRYFEFAATREWDAALLCKDSLAIIMVDIDYFKLYNDMIGHIKGDAVLREVALALSGALFRVSDVVSRYGGEEFVIILPDTNAENARIVCERLMESINASHIPFKSPISDHLTISLGCYTGLPSHDSTFDKFVQRADEALYQSKKDGRNRYSIYTAANYEV
jgi:diguanylate cyclase (GGDEF)-like protein